MATASTCKFKPQTEEEIVEGFNRLRYEQRSIGSKINDLELDQREHKYVNIFSFFVGEVLVFLVTDCF